MELAPRYKLIVISVNTVYTVYNFQRIVGQTVVVIALALKEGNLLKMGVCKKEHQTICSQMPKPPSPDFTLLVSSSLEMGREGMEVIRTFVGKISTSQRKNLRDCLT